MTSTDATGRGAPCEQLVGDRHDPVEVVLGAHEEQRHRRSRSGDDAVDQPDVGQLLVADGCVGAGDRDDAVGDRLEEGTHQVAPGREEPEADPVAVDPRVGPQRGQRGGHVVAGDAQRVVVDEAVLEHRADESGVCQQRAVRRVRRPLRRPDLAVLRDRTAVHHQDGGSRGPVREVEVEVADAVGRDRLMRQDEGSEVGREVLRVVGHRPPSQHTPPVSVTRIRLRPMPRLPFDPIDEAARQWGKRWDGVPAMHAVTSLMRVQQLVLGRLDAILRPHGLTFARYEALVLLCFSSRGSLPLGKMGERLQVHPTSITSIVQRLGADGLVTRRPHPEDGRAILAEVTDGRPGVGRGGHRRPRRGGLRARVAHRRRARPPVRAAAARTPRGGRPRLTMTRMMAPVRGRR